MENTPHQPGVPPAQPGMPSQDMPPPGYTFPPQAGGPQPQYSLPPNEYRAPATGFPPQPTQPSAPTTGYPSAQYPPQPGPLYPGAYYPPQPGPGYPSQPYPYSYVGAPSMAPVPTTKKSNTTLIAIISAVVAIAIIAAGIGIVLANHGPAAGKGGTSTGSVAPGDHGVGEVVMVDGTWAITVTGATTTLGDQFDQQQLKAGDTYLDVSLTVKNITSTTQDFTGLIDFSVRTPTSTIVQEGFLTTATTPDGTFQSGDQIAGQVPFEVSASDHHFQMIFDYQQVYGAPVTWDLTV
jgi:hypothetical protein